MRYIFGNPAFGTKNEAMEYLREELRDENAGRYRHSNAIDDVDSIIFAFDGKLLAELVVESVEDWTKQDRELWPPTRKAYQIKEVRIFRNRTVKARDVGLTQYRFGKQVSNRIYKKLIDEVGGIEQTIRI